MPGKTMYLSALYIQSTPDNLNLLGKMKKVQVIGSLMQSFTELNLGFFMSIGLGQSRERKKSLNCVQWYKLLFLNNIKSTCGALKEIVPLCMMPATLPINCYIALPFIQHFCSSQSSSSHIGHTVK